MFFHYRYGGVDFFFLDDRYHRDPKDEPDSPEKTHLGTAQLSWLKTQLSESDAAFKVIIAGGPWSTFKASDSWGDFLHERNGIFDFIRDEKDDFRVMEMELIEPSMYLRMDAAAPARFAQAIDTWFSDD